MSATSPSIRNGISRRDAVRVLGAGGALAGMPQGLAAMARSGARGREDRRLLLVFLDGGNDGLNTVVPVEDDHYHRARPKLRLGREQLLALDELTGLHPALRAWEPLWKEGRLAVLRDVGYPDPDRSHFVSRDIWHSGRRTLPDAPTGWLGRAMEARDGRELPPVGIGEQEAPLILRGRQRSGLTLRDLDALAIQTPGGMRAERIASLRKAARVAEESSGALARIASAADGAYELSERLRASIERVPAGEDYPGHRLARNLRLAARLVRAESGPPVLWTRLGGFDTHAVQPGTHAALLGQLGSGLRALLDDLARDGSDARTLVLVYSEFGRRVRENGSQGTDHGAAGPVLALAGNGLDAGLHGGPSDLGKLHDGDLRHQFDFRAVFRETVERWLGWSSEGLFDGGPPRVGFLD